MRRCPMSAQARSGKQRAATHPRTMGGLRRRLLPRLFKFPARAAPVDHGFLAEVRVLLRWHCTGQGRRATGCDDRRVREATTARCSGKLLRYAPDISIYLFVISTKILHYSGCLTFVVLLCALTIATEIRQLSVVRSTILKPDRW